MGFVRWNFSASRDEPRFAYDILQKRGTSLSSITPKPIKTGRGPAATPLRGLRPERAAYGCKRGETKRDNARRTPSNGAQPRRRDNAPLGAPLRLELARFRVVGIASALALFDILWHVIIAVDSRHEELT